MKCRIACLDFVATKNTMVKGKARCVPSLAVVPDGHRILYRGCAAPEPAWRLRCPTRRHRGASRTAPRLVMNKPEVG